VLGLVFLQFDAYLLMRDVSVEGRVPFNPVVSHRYFSEYGFRPRVRRWCMIWARVCGFCAKGLQWMTIVSWKSRDRLSALGRHRSVESYRTDWFSCIYSCSRTYRSELFNRVLSNQPTTIPVSFMPHEKCSKLRRHRSLLAPWWDLLDPATIKELSGPSFSR
jgi:hypothetical protein